MWFEPHWIFPNWITNSQFFVATPITCIGASTTAIDPQTGRMVTTCDDRMARSVIRNMHVEIEMLYDILDASPGINQGNEPADTGSVPDTIISDPDILRQTYNIKNITGEIVQGNGIPLTGMRFYQFLHGLNQSISVYDDRVYNGADPFIDYHYDITQTNFGVIPDFQVSDDPVQFFPITTSPFSGVFDVNTQNVVVNNDTIAFHTKHKPNRWENGYFGRTGFDSHQCGKPTYGVHLSVEGKELAGSDDPPGGDPDADHNVASIIPMSDPNYDTQNPPGADVQWVGGAQQFNFFERTEFLSDGNLDPDEVVSIDVLLTIRTDSEINLTDSDGNGIPDKWEQYFFYTNGIDGNLDSDNDGSKDIDEYYASTDPLDPKSFFKRASANPNVTDSNDIDISFQTLPGKTYRVYYTDDIGGNPVQLTQLNGDIVGDGTVMTITDVGGGAGSKRFYIVAALESITN